MKKHLVSIKWLNPFTYNNSDKIVQVNTLHDLDL